MVVVTSRAGRRTTTGGDPFGIALGSVEFHARRGNGVSRLPHLAHEGFRYGAIRIVDPQGLAAIASGTRPRGPGPVDPGPAARDG